MTIEQAIKIAIEVLTEKDKEMKGKANQYIDAAIRLNLLEKFEIRESHILNRYFSKFDILCQMEKLDSVIDLPKKQRKEMVEDYKYINEHWR